MLKFERRSFSASFQGLRAYILDGKEYTVPEEWSDLAAKILVTKYMAPHEASVDDVFGRVVTQIVTWGKSGNYFCDRDSEVCFAKELFAIFFHQFAMVNSPALFNLGRPDRPQIASACYVMTVEDSLEDILDQAKREGMIFKAGAGVGVDLSKLRGRGAPLSPGGCSSGPVSFLKGLDTFAGTIRSGGVTRRAARLSTLDIRHPDILEFIRCKPDEEKKAHALLRAGFSGGLNGEAYNSINFQNTNLSVRVTDEFMEAATRTGTEESKLLYEMAQACWECGDPGLIFVDTMNAENPCPNTFESLYSNACCEITLPPNFPCVLASINLQKMYKHSTSELQHLARIMIVALDIIAGNADYPSEEIGSNAKKYRPLGLGVTGLGARLMMERVGYGTPEGRNTARDYLSVIRQSAGVTSRELARLLGSSLPEYSGREITDLPRNMMLTALAPAGTISLLMDAETTGIEPLFNETVYKETVDGDIIEQRPKCWDEVGSYQNYSAIYATAMRGLVPEDHLEMMATLQPYVTQGISKTVNVPNDCTAEDIVDIYVEAWRRKIKVVSVYRDGSKSCQVLTTENISEEKAALAPPARKLLPSERSGIIKKFKLGGKTGYVTAGTYEDGSLGEVFVEMDGEGTTLGGLLNSLSIVTSIALQHGVPLQTLARKMMRQNFAPQGFTGDESIRSATSVVDFVFRWLLSKFEKEGREEQRISKEEIPCPECGSQTVPSGKCRLCPKCGTSIGGCS